MGTVCPAAIQRVVSYMEARRTEYQKEFDEIIYPFLLKKYSLSQKEYQRDLKIVTDLLVRRFRPSIEKEARMRSAKMNNVDRHDLYEDCVSAGMMAVFNCARQADPTTIGRFTEYVRKCITLKVIQEISYLVEQSKYSGGGWERLTSDMSPSSDFSVDYDGVALREALLEKVSRLSQEDRDLLAAYYQQEKTYREIGEGVGTTRQAICERLGKVVDRLRSLFTEEEMEEYRDTHKEME